MKPRWLYSGFSHFLATTRAPVLLATSSLLLRPPFTSLMKTNDLASYLWMLRGPITVECSTRATCIYYLCMCSYEHSLVPCSVCGCELCLSSSFSTTGSGLGDIYQQAGGVERVAPHSQVRYLALHALQQHLLTMSGVLLGESTASPTVLTMITNG